MIRAEIRNTHKGNQGAQLMLRALVQRLRQTPDTTWKLAVAGRCATPETRRELDLVHLPWVQRLGNHADIFSRLLPPIHPPGFIKSSRLDVIFDASGFAYGDQWGPEKARMAAAYFGRAKKRGTRIILMPQALGPFEGKAIQDAFREVVELADLVFPRDPTSLAAVEAVMGGPRDHVRRSPDFTHGLHGIPPTTPLSERTVGLIPNQKMLQMGASGRDAYVSLFARIAKGIFARDLQPMLILHSVDDRNLAQAISDQVGRDIDMREEAHPLRVKGLIGQCYAAVSSRFHGLVNALSSSVPAMGTGWSHKYQHLMADFDSEDLLIDVDISDDDLDAKLASMLESPSREERVAKLESATQRQLEENEKMWAAVINCARKGRRK